MAKPNEEQGFFAPQPKWRTLLDRLAPFKGFSSPRAGEEVLVHWIEAIPLPGRSFGLQVGWRIHKPGKRGMGKGKPLSTLPPEMDACAEPEDMAVIKALSFNLHKKDQGKYPVKVRLEETGDVLELLSRVRFVYLEETGERAAFDPFPILPRIIAREDGEGLLLSGEWVAADGRTWYPDSPKVFGGPKPWIEEKGILRPVFGAADGTALAQFMALGARVSPSEVGSFLGSSVPMLQNRGALVRVEAGYVMDPADKDSAPRPRLYLGEEGGALHGALRFLYGEFEVQAENPDPVLILDIGGGKITVNRDMEAEFSAVSLLRSHGFNPTDPGHFEMEGERALDFVRLELPDLSRRWEILGQDTLRRHRVRQRAVSLNIRLSAGTDWLDLYTDASCGDEEVDVMRVLKALRRGSRYVRLGDGSHALLPEEWAKRLGTLLDETGVSGQLTRLPSYMQPLLDELSDELPGVEIVNKAGWQKVARSLSEEGGKREAVPKTLACTLRPYQLKGYRWLRKMGAADFGAVLADDMGLGKTVQTLALLVKEKESGARGPSLVVAPTSVVHNWEQEVRRHAPTLTTLRHHGAERGKNLGNLGSIDIVITSYAILRRDVRELTEINWNYLILDEAQAIKNAATQTARAAHKLNARRRLALTGTLLENHLGELWSHFNFLTPGLLGTQVQFVKNFERPIIKGDREAAEKLKKRIRPFILRRMKHEVAPELPPKVENVLWSEFLPEQEELYKKLLAAGRERVLEAVEKRGVTGARACILDVLLRLRQVCCHPRVLPDGLGSGVGSAKFDQFRDFVTEVIEEGNRVLIYSQFVQVLKILKGWFERQNIPHLYMDGRSRDREETVRRFQEDPSIPAFLVSLKAGGTGLNLTGADYVILFDPWWNPAVEAQAADRAHRIGREGTVFFYRMVAKSSVEEKIRLMQERKKAVADDFVRSEHQWGLPSTKDELLELFEY